MNLEMNRTWPHAKNCLVQLLNQLPFKKNDPSFLWSPVDPRPLAYYRIFTGVVIFTMYLALGPHWNDFFGPSGIANEPPGRMNLFSWGSFLPIEFYWYFALFISLCFTVGFQTKIATIFLFLLQSTMVHVNRMTVNGEDLVYRFMLFYSIFACLNGTLSVDAWLKKKMNKPAPTGRMWSIRLIQMNVAMIYLFSLPAKLRSDATWLTGDFMYYTLVNSTWSRFPFPTLAYEWWFVAPMTYSALLMEGIFPIFVWFRSLRLPLVLLISLFHLTIGIILANVTYFSLAMVSGFIVFLTEEDLKKIEFYVAKSKIIFIKYRKRQPKVSN
jgi:hypothetical protein